jgi:ATP-dependent phosphofructokinase / diphosphate-dependent phosphofructokinase
VRIGMLTGGGDCPGLNAVIRAVVHRADAAGDEVIGFRDGWRGPLKGASRPLHIADVAGILARGGTILGSSRTNPYAQGEGGADAVRATMAAQGVDALVAIGGEDTLGAAARLAAEGVRVVGVPKTIDNDLAATDYTFGFDTAVHIATEAVDRLRTTAESHRRALVCEVMGRHAGWIALHAGMAGGANAIIVPERPFTVGRVCDWVNSCFRNEYAPVIVVSEGAVPDGGDELISAGGTDAFGHRRLGGVGTWLADEIERETGAESRAVVLGHIQRGGTPTAYDRVLATRFGVQAVAALHDGESGVMVALRGTDIVRVSLDEATAELKTVPTARLDEAEVFFG